MELLNAYNSFNSVVKKISSNQNSRKTFEQHYSKIKSEGNRIVLVSPRTYGKTTFVAKKALIDSLANKRSLILTTNHAQAKLFKTKLKNMVNELKLDKQLLKNIEVLAINLNTRGMTYRYEYIYVDDIDYIDSARIEELLDECNEDNKVILTISGMPITNGTHHLKEIYPDFSITTMSDRKFEGNVATILTLQNSIGGYCNG